MPRGPWYPGVPGSGFCSCMRILSSSVGLLMKLDMAPAGGKQDADRLVGTCTAQGLKSRNHMDGRLAVLLIKP